MSPCRSDTHSRQQLRVLEALKSPEGITSGELKDEYGIVDGRKRISELRRKGLNITDTWVTLKNRYGEPTRCKVYRLEA